MSRVLHLDYETASELDLTKVGAYRYAEHPSTMVLIASYAFNDGPVQQWLPTEDFSPIPDDLHEALSDDETLVKAWNANFERQITERVLGIPAPAWKYRCTMVALSACGFPGKLEQAALAAGLPEDLQKKKTGAALIRTFCRPRKPTKKKPWLWNTPTTEPEKWAQFKEYGAQDVVTERAVGHRLRKFPLPAREQRLWEIDQGINDRGVRVDMGLVDQAMAIGARHRDRLIARAIEITGLENPNSRDQLKGWLEAADPDMLLPDLTKDTVEKLVEHPLTTPVAREVLEIRQQIAKASLKKYEAIKRSVCSDGRVRGVLQFMGAFRTGRWAGRLLQIQNLPTPTIEDLELLSLARRLVLAGDYDTLMFLFPSVPEVLSTLIRSVIVPAPGKKLVAVDFSAIEAVLTAWMTNCEWRLEVFRTHGKIYEASAATAFKMSLEGILNYKKETGKHHPIRKKGKIIELACGFGGAEGALINMGALDQGIPEEELRPMVNAWRAASPEIVRAWWAIDKAVKRAIRNPGTKYDAVKCSFIVTNRLLQITMPSGRTLFYVDPSLEDDVIRYYGIHQVTRQWTQIESYGPKFFENCIAEGTAVLTDSGWVAIEDVRTTDKVHDGVEFVQHRGVVFKSVQACVSVDGVEMTPDHEVLTDEGWKTASQQPRPYRPNIRYADSRESGPHRWKEVVLAFPMQVWRALCKERHKGHSGAEARGDTELRLLNKGTHRRREHTTRYEHAPSLSGVAEHARSMRPSNSSVMEEVWRPWNNRLRSVARILQEFLGRHGTLVHSRTGSESQGQRRAILPEELQLGDAPGEHNEPTEYDEGCGRSSIEQGHRNLTLDDLLSDSARLPSGETERPPKPLKPVYDILNAGPRMRFVVKGEQGPFIVHNCIQAMARDCLCDTLLEVEEKGLMDITMLVHDEIVGEHDRSVLSEVLSIMAKKLPYAPGLPLKGAGYEGADFYYKD